jgi:hypothetical protein
MNRAKPAPRRLEAAAAVLALVAFSHFALAVDRQAIRRVCENDLRIYCAGIPPGGGRLMQCARAHEAQLSAACRAALTNVEAYRKAWAR